MSFPSIEIHIPLSPTTVMLNMLKCATLSLRQFGGRCGDARVVATIGDKDLESGLKMCRRQLFGMDIDLRPADEKQYGRYGCLWTAVQRLEHQFEADVIILADADILIAGQLDDLVQRVHDEQAIAGVIAYVNPFKCYKGLSWEGLFQRAGLPAPECEFEHPGWVCYANDDRHDCPAYFNYGFVAGPRDMMRDIGAIARPMLETALSYNPADSFQAQIGLSLCIVKLGLPAIALPMRYNFPNAPEFEIAYPWETSLIRVLHIMRRDILEKMHLYEDPEVMDRFSRRDWALKGVEVEFTRHNHLLAVHRRAAEVFRAILPSLASA